MMEVNHNSQLQDNQNILDALNTEKKLCKELFLNKNNQQFDCITFLSLLSLVFKRKINTDELVQFFEVNFVRQNCYKITSLVSFYNLLEEETRDLIESEFYIFKKIIKNINDYLSNNNIENDNGVIKIIKIIEECLEDEKSKVSNTTANTQMEIQNKKNKKYVLTPTQGISMLNNNPYSFFVKKILKINTVEPWQVIPDQRFYGIIIHLIMENFTKKCRVLTIQEGIDDVLEKLFEGTINEVLMANKVSMNDFLRKKLLNMKDIAISLEKNCILTHRIVFVEKKYSIIIDDIRIEAKADRIEVDNVNKNIYIYDYKTGNLPTDKQENNGEKTQLLIIAVLLLNQSYYQDYNIKKMVYLDLSGKAETKLNNEYIDIANISLTYDRLKKMVSQYFQNGEPILENMQYISPIGMVYDSDKETMQFYRSNFL